MPHYIFISLTKIPVLTAIEQVNNMHAKTLHKM
jgi:hypothetical protein